MTGMMWYDPNPKKDLKVKVEQAAAYFAQKYSSEPNLCAMHPAMNPPESIGEIAIRADKSILPNHFLIGMAETEVTP